MTATQEKISHDFNHETTIGLKCSEEDRQDFYGYSPLSVQILEDFLKPAEMKNLNFPEGHPLFEIIKMEHFKFEQRIFGIARQFIQNYGGGMWVHNGDGIYCLTAEPTDRFHVVNGMNWSDEHCNTLEMGIALTLIALDGGMNSRCKEFANAMIYFRSTLMQLIEEQYEDGCTIINTNKIVRLID